MSWFSLESAIIAAACMVPVLPSLYEVLENNYFDQEMYRVAFQIFASRYMSWFWIALVVGHGFLVVVMFVSSRIVSLRNAIVFSLIVLLSVVGLHMLVSNLAVHFLSYKIFSNIMAVHTIPEEFQQSLHEISDRLLEPLLKSPFFVESLLDLRDLALLYLVEFCVGLFAVWIVYWLINFRRSSTGRNPHRTRKALRKLPLFSTYFAWLCACCLLPLSVVVVSRYLMKGPSHNRPNILLISIDTLRADHLSCYGYEQATTPAIDKIARDGMLFTKAISQSSWTLPSHASMMTALYPIEHGCNAVQGVRLSSEVNTLAEILSEHGYRTVAITSVYFVSPAYGLHQGFEHFDYSQTTADVIVKKALGLLGAELAEPFFLFLHLFDPHDPYTPPQEYRDLFVGKDMAEDVTGHLDELVKEKGREGKGRAVYKSNEVNILKKLYDAEIRFTDDQIERIFYQLQEMEVFDRTIIIVTSDHGESLGEHDELGHGNKLFSEQTHVPLIIRYPRRIPSGFRYDGIVEASVQIMPIILDLAGIPYDGAVENVLAIAQFPNGVTASIAHSETFLSVVPQYSVEDDTWKVIATVVDQRPEPAYASLYNQREDWGNMEDKAETNNEIVENFINSHLMDYLAKADNIHRHQVEKVTISRRRIEQLRALGYLQ